MNVLCYYECEGCEKKLFIIFIGAGRYYRYLVFEFYFILFIPSQKIWSCWSVFETFKKFECFWYTIESILDSFSVWMIYSSKFSTFSFISWKNHGFSWSTFFFFLNQVLFIQKGLIWKKFNKYFIQVFEFFIIRVSVFLVYLIHNPSKID